MPTLEIFSANRTLLLRYEVKVVLLHEEEGRTQLLPMAIFPLGSSSSFPIPFQSPKGKKKEKLRAPKQEGKSNLHTEEHLFVYVFPSPLRAGRKKAINMVTRRRRNTQKEEEEERHSFGWVCAFMRACVRVCVRAV